MKLSADPKSPDWSPAAYTARVLLDGCDLADVRFADEDKGYCERFVIDAGDRPRLCWCQREIMTELKFGKVQIVL